MSPTLELLTPTGVDLPPLVETDDREVRRALRTQLAALDRRLSAALPQVQEAGSAGVMRLAPAGAGPRAAPRILGVAALERERDALYDRVRVAEEAAAHRAAGRATARARLEAMLADPAAHRWERVSREELGEPGCGEWRVRPRVGLLGMLAGWWEVKLSSGCPLGG